MSTCIDYTRERIRQIQSFAFAEHAILGTIFFSYCFIGFLAFQVGSSVGAQYWCTVLGSSLGVYGIVLQRKSALRIAVAAGIVVLWIIVCSYITGNLRQRFIFVVAQFGLLWCLRYKRISSVWFAVLYLGWSLFYAVILARGMDPNEACPGTSRNGISCIVLWGCSLLLITREQAGLKINSVWALPALAVSYLAVGRGGVISAIVLLLMLIYGEVKKMAVTAGKTKLIWGGFLCSLILIVFSVKDELMSARMVSEIEVRGLESKERSAVIGEYLGAMGIRGFVFGMDPSVSPMMVQLDNNPHNSVINAHMALGVIALPLLIALIAAMLKSMFVPTVSGAVFMALFVRSLTDNVHFIDFFDFIIIYAAWNVLQPYKCKTING